MEKEKVIKHGLVGRFFHELDSKTGKIKNHGIVVDSPEPGWYLVMFFDFFMGEGHHQELFRLKDMKGWMFYSTRDWYIRVAEEMSKR